MTSVRLALIGAPNCGKSTLFNGLTGGRARTANYSGVTVETKTGRFATADGHDVELVDLPGIYGLDARSADERIAMAMITGDLAGQAAPDALIVLVDAAQLRTHLHTVLQMCTLNRPVLVVLNMIDLAERDGLKIDVDGLEKRLGLPVVTARATRESGRDQLLMRLNTLIAEGWASSDCQVEQEALPELQRRARAIANEIILHEPVMNRFSRQTDRILLHPLAGPAILSAILFVMFQAVYAWSAPFMDLTEAGASATGNLVERIMPEGLVRELIVDGVVAGVGSVLVFLPQIIILFCFILVLEASGYMARAAVLMDELMLRIGLNGRAFIPLLSSFACAVPGMMSARTIENERDRLTTILIAPLMTCSARLPVYTLIIAAFIPPDPIGPFNLQGLVLFGLYMTGVFSAILVAFVLKRTLTSGRPQLLVMELPGYKLPNPRDFLLSLWSHISAFLRRAGTVILATSIGLWFLARFPLSASGLSESFAGQIGGLLETVLKPIGFNLEISIALVPGLAAREVAVGALGTIYAVQGSADNTDGLAGVLQSAWSLPTAMAFLAWYVFAPQCFATLATARRETNSWGWTAFMFGYLIALAYIAAGTTYHLAVLAGL